MIRALIVDDEVHARDEMEALLRETGEFSIVGKCADALEAIRAVRLERPDVLFLDIQMPVLGGFELLSMIEEEIMPNVVFVTAYDEYALKAFEANSIDYLLKPVEKARLAKTIPRLKKMLREGDRPVHMRPELKRIPCVSSNRIRLIDISDIEYVKSDISGIHVVCAKGTYYTELTLKVLEGRANFVRCHRQFVVNIDQVDEIVLGENLLALIVTKSGKNVPVSRRYLKRLKEIIGICVPQGRN
jgi:two-component system, LytTR family, response regulator